MNIHNKLKNLGFKKKGRVKYGISYNQSMEENYRDGISYVLIEHKLEPDEKSTYCYYKRSYSGETLIIKTRLDVICMLYHIDTNTGELFEKSNYLYDPSPHHYTSYRNSFNSYKENVYDLSKIKSESSIIETFPDSIKRDVVLDKIFNI